MVNDMVERIGNQMFTDSTDFVLSYAVPKARPLPSLDSSTPIPAGKGQVEKFFVATDTQGGD
jgi:hypothetical protein